MIISTFIIIVTIKRYKYLFVHKSKILNLFLYAFFIS